MRGRKILLLINFVMLLAGMVLLLASIQSGESLRSLLVAVVILWNLLDIINYFKGPKA